MRRVCSVVSSIFEKQWTNSQLFKSLIAHLPALRSHQRVSSDTDRLDPESTYLRGCHWSTGHRFKQDDAKEPEELLQVQRFPDHAALLRGRDLARSSPACRYWPRTGGGIPTREDQRDFAQNWRLFVFGGQFPKPSAPEWPKSSGIFQGGLVDWSRLIVGAESNFLPIVMQFRLRIRGNTLEGVYCCK